MVPPPFEQSGHRAQDSALGSGLRVFPSLSRWSLVMAIANTIFTKSFSPGDFFDSGCNHRSSGGSGRVLLGTSAGQVDRTPNHSTSVAGDMGSSNAYGTSRTFSKRPQSAATFVTSVTKSPLYQQLSKYIVLNDATER